MAVLMADLRTLWSLRQKVYCNTEHASTKANNLLWLSALRGDFVENFRGQRDAVHAENNNDLVRGRIDTAI
jgi:hypothetical protein